MITLIKTIVLTLTLGLVSTTLQLQEETDTLKTELKLVQILFRHGDRTPVMNYPNDPYKESTWENYGGFGQLTQTGMQQHFYFGKFLRNHYANFISQFYNRENARIVSTDFDRTLMSAYSLLNGLYSPVDYQIWNENVTWQPIPVHTTDKSSDKIFYGERCPRLDQLKKQIEKSDEYLRVNERYQPLFDIVDKNSGCLEDSDCAHMNLDDEWKVGNCLFVERTHNLTLPDWVLPIYDQLQESKGWGFYFNNRLPEMAKLQAGGILKDMIVNIKKKVYNEKSKDQLRLYSGHDTYVAAMSKLLNITTYINQPAYASAVVLELRKDLNSDSYFIQAILKNNTANEPINYINLTIDGCDSLCPLKRFMEITKDLVIHDYAEECKYKLADANLIYDAITSEQGKRFYENMSLIIIGLVMVTTVLIIVAILKKAKSDEQKNYRQLNDDESLRDV